MVNGDEKDISGGGVYIECENGEGMFFSGVGKVSR